jgi:superfamily II DNA helicase RecQ
VGVTSDGRSLDLEELRLLRIREAPGFESQPRARKKRIESRHADQASLSPEETALESRLRIWRSAEAKKQGFPAYCIFPDKTMRAIATDRPTNTEELQLVDGMGPAKITRYGAEICRICASN